MESSSLKYICKRCGCQMLKINESSLLKIAVSMMFSSYLENGTFVLEGVCEECSLDQQIIFCAGAVKI